MIKRSYFISAQKPHNDGFGSYSFHHMIVSYRSWLPIPEYILVDAKEKLLKHFHDKGLKGNGIDVQAFNRI